MNKLKVILGLVCFSAAFSLPAHAVIVPYINRTSFDLAYPGASVENWDEYASGTVIANGSTVNGIKYSIPSTSEAPTVTNFWPTTSGSKSLGIANVKSGNIEPLSSITFTFAQPLIAFSIDIFTEREVYGAYSATLSNGAVIESYVDPYPGQTGGDFIGFSDTTPFTSITITDPAGATYHAPYGPAYSVDSLHYVTEPIGGAPTPEPPTMALLTLGLIGMAAFKRNTAFNLFIQKRVK